jgi:hypothetical protein
MLDNDGGIHLGFQSLLCFVVPEDPFGGFFCTGFFFGAHASNPRSSLPPGLFLVWVLPVLQN